jgi:hypothetical protein
MKTALLVVSLLVIFDSGLNGILHVFPEPLLILSYLGCLGDILILSRIARNKEVKRQWMRLTSSSFKRFRKLEHP